MVLELDRAPGAVLGVEDHEVEADAPGGLHLRGAGHLRDQPAEGFALPQPPSERRAAHRAQVSAPARIASVTLASMSAKSSGLTIRPRSSEARPRCLAASTSQPGQIGSLASKTSCGSRTAKPKAFASDA